MKLLVVGSGGREHALVWKLAQSPGVTQITCAPGNAGIAQDAECLNVRALDLDGLVEFARAEGIDLTVVGPEIPLIAGLGNRLRAAGLKVFGPTAAAAQIEGSKTFAKELMRRAGVPTARYEAFEDAGAAEKYVRSLDSPCVVKADGEAGGKGAVVCGTVDEALAAMRSMLVKRQFGPGGDRILIEERMEGPEFSFMACVQGEAFVPLASSQDHKRIFDGNRGPNTGGMGAYSPVPFVTPDLETEVAERIVRPLLRGMAEDGIEFQGLLYPGLMLTRDGLRVVEFNCRFGDPETECVLPRLESDLLELLQATAEGRLAEVTPRWSGDACATVVIAAAGYPPAPLETGQVIHGLEAAEETGAVVFHSGTALNPDGKIVTAGGRVLAVTALGPDLSRAVSRAYQAVDCIEFEGAQWRRDIGPPRVR